MLTCSTDCEKGAQAMLCKDCFDTSEHRFHDFKEIKGAKRDLQSMLFISNFTGKYGFCHCGIKESWSQQRLCTMHKNELQELVICEVQIKIKETVIDQAKNRAQSGVTYYEVNGQRIPLRQERVQVV